jgi:hypothetical protein
VAASHQVSILALGTTAWPLMGPSLSVNVMQYLMQLVRGVRLRATAAFQTLRPTFVRVLIQEWERRRAAQAAAGRVEDPDEILTVVGAAGAPTREPPVSEVGLRELLLRESRHLEWQTTVSGKADELIDSRDSVLADVARAETVGAVEEIVSDVEALLRTLRIELQAPTLGDA